MKNVRPYLFLCLLTTIFFIFSETVCANVFYIDANIGSDDNSGTEANPWKTIDKANLTLGPGDMVYIKAGVYSSETIAPVHSGEPGKNITYKNARGNKVIVRDATRLIDLSNKNYIVIDGICFEKANSDKHCCCT